jgi:asparagine synthase (glutamine-hydrolysing)
MSDELRHRGPDDGGVYVDADAGVALGHRRLSILDLSEAGHQPMRSSTGRYVITFNGEIYNFAELSAELAALGHAFRGHSDTEVMLAAFTEWGVERAVRRFNGMFAFAVWDAEQRVLFLARDRLGEKPLYYGWVGKALVFGSELKALRAHPAFTGDVDRGALALYFRLSCVPAPHTIYRGIRKLPPGKLLTVRANGLLRCDDPVPYWSAREVAERGAAAPLDEPAEAIVDELDKLLRSAVKLRMQADVPLGAFLSGGVDSSTIVALMQAQSTRRVKTFSIGVHDPKADEAGHAKRVAEHLGTDHTEHYVTSEEVLAVVPKLPDLFDEPFADSSQVPTYLVSALARKHVTVSLSGDGGDELFAGYHRHFWRLWERVTRVPAALRKAGGRGLSFITSQGDAWRKLSGLTSLVTDQNPRDKLYKLASTLEADSVEQMYVSFVSNWKRPLELVRGATEPTCVLTDPTRWANLDSSTRRIMFLDLVSYLPDDILVKVDRASMGVSLESRAPFLDHRVVELAARIPLALNLRHRHGKWPVRKVLERYVPPSLTERPKHGFGIPLLSWLRGPLRDWAESLLSERRLREDGFLNPALVRAKWADYLGGTGNWQYAIWDVLVFNAWLDRMRSLRSGQPSSTPPSLSWRPPSAVPPAGISSAPPPGERSVRVLHIFGRLDRGGAEMRTVGLMRRIDRSRFKLEFAALSGLPGSLDADVRAMGGEVHLCKIDAPSFLRSFRKLLRDGHYDVVHSHVHHTSGLILRLAKAEGVPVRIAHFRSTGGVEKGTPVRRIQRGLMTRWIDTCATDIFAVSEGAMRAAWGERWAADPRCHVLYNGVDPTAFLGGPAEAREEMGVAPGDPLFIHVGSLTYPKNHLRLLEIFREIVDRTPGARLWLVGRNAENLEAEVRTRVVALGLEDNVSLLGERADVPRLLQAADAMIFPSRYEGMPGAVLEAAAAGTPVLGTDLPGILEIARHVQTVQCMSLTRTNGAWADAALRLVGAGPDGRVDRAAARRAFAESIFTIDRAATEYTAALAKAVERGAATAT